MLAYNDLYGLHHFWLWYYPYKVFAWTFLYGDGYQFWSGIGIAAFFPMAYWYHHNCHVKKCWRIGKVDPEHNWPACRIHHSQSEKLGVVAPTSIAASIAEPSLLEEAEPTRKSDS